MSRLNIPKQMSVLLFFLFLGAIFEHGLGVPIPHTILGLLFLLLALLFNVVSLSSISSVGDFLLRHLAILFIPAGVGLITILGPLKSQLLPIILICVITTWVMMIFTGFLVEWMIKWKKY